jgi:pimeloyl-ACP methyl ester carboxylesterase
MSWLRMAWGKLFYSATAGSGVPLVFLHGTGCDSADWAPVIRALPDGTAAIRLDFRGHGQSDVPTEEFTIDDLAGDVVALLDHLTVQNAVLVGHSLGGMVAMNVAARSARAAGLVLLEGWTSLRACEAFAGDRLHGRLDRLEVERIQRKSEKTRKRFDPVVWGRFWKSVEAFDALPYLKAAGIPITEVYGEMGRTESTRQMLRIPDNPRIQVLWIPTAGHYLPHERPDEVARISRQAALGRGPAD